MKINHSRHYNNNISRGTNKQLFVCLHHTASIGDGNINVLAGLTNRQVSVHYLVRQDGEIYQFVDDDKIARHLGQSKYFLNGERLVNCNQYAIGIEVESDGYNFTDEQRKAVRELINYLINKYGIGTDCILRHKDFTDRKRDIGDNFWNNKYQTRAEYQNSFIINNKTMDDKTKKLILQSIEKSNSGLRDNLEVVKKNFTTEELKEKASVLQEHLADINKLIRNLIKKLS